MELRKRMLQRMKKEHRVFFVCFIGLSLLINIPSELLYTNSYKINLTHCALLVSIILLILNPTGIRLLVLSNFVYLLYMVINSGSYPMSGGLTFDPNSTLYGFPLHEIGTPLIVNRYIHIGVYLFLVLFTFTLPFAPKKKNNSELIDTFE